MARNHVSSFYGAAYRASETFKETEHVTIPRTERLLVRSLIDFSVVI